MDQPLVPLFDYPVADILRVLPEESSPLWDHDRSRQETYPVHRRTRSIIFDWLDNNWEVGGPVNVKRHDYAPQELAAAVYDCAAKLEKHFSGKLVRMTLAELAPHARIAAHIDNGIGVTAVHRCHVPIVTNENVHFYIDRVSHYLKPDVAYEFDNTRLHAVDNQSDMRRVHLLCDIMPPGLLT
jgi:hypothetical protein